MCVYKAANQLVNIHLKCVHIGYITSIKFHIKNKSLKNPVTVVLKFFCTSDTLCGCVPAEARVKGQIQHLGSRYSELPKTAELLSQCHSNFAGCQTLGVASEL